MKGTVFDFLKLTTEKPELAKELVELAAKHDFNFTDEVSDEDLESVSGGLYAQLGTASQDQQVSALQQSIQMESRKYQTISNAITASAQAEQNTINNLKS